MEKKECIAMLLAGGEGKRLDVLTHKLAKPAVYFGGKYRIIDFPLSNCANSGINTVGVLTQYEPLVLHNYIGIGSPWDLDRQHGGVTVLPPYMERGGGQWYTGTANAIYQNMHFIEQYQPEHVLVLSGDHIYKMNYAALLQYHKEKNADVTICVIEVPWSEASRFGIVQTNHNQQIIHFIEKPEAPQSNSASMGIYMFKWSLLKKYLIEDEKRDDSNHDFGKDIIPYMLTENRNIFAFPYKGYWRDVGTIESLWRANMDLLEDPPLFQLHDPHWRIYSKNYNRAAHYISPSAIVRRALINEGCQIYGEVNYSVLFHGVSVGQDTEINDSVIMPDVKIGQKVKIYRAIIGEGTVIEDNCQIGFADRKSPITLVGEDELISNRTLANI